MEGGRHQKSIIEMITLLLLLLLLLLLSHFSRAQLCATPWTAAYQAPPSIGFSRQEYWSGLPLPSPMITLLSVKQIESGKLLCCTEFSSMLCGDLEAWEGEEGGRLVREGVYVIHEQVHFAVLQKLTQHCKATTLV